MARNTGNLTHHEELRLDYLRKNIYYLNDNEEQELHYLEQRAQGLVGPSRRASRPKPSYVDLPSYRKDHEREVYPNSLADEDDILPAYPREERRRKQRRPKPKPMKKEIPVIEEIAPEPKIRKKARRSSGLNESLS